MIIKGNSPVNFHETQILNLLIVQDRKTFQ